MSRIITHAETNKLIRKALKAAFPGVKFSVTGSNWSSTNVSWNDGPTKDEVDAVAGFYCSGKGMDRSSDYTVTGDSELTESITITEEKGEEKIKVTIPAGESVHFAPTYVFTSRSFSEETKAEATEKAAELMGVAEIGRDTNYTNEIGPIESFTGSRFEDYHSYGELIVTGVAGVIASAKYAGMTPEEFVAAREDAEIAAAEKWAADQDEARYEAEVAEEIVSVEAYAETTGETAEVVDLAAAEDLILSALTEIDPLMYPAFKLLDELKARGIG